MRDDDACLVRGTHEGRFRQWGPPRPPGLVESFEADRETEAAAMPKHREGTHREGGPSRTMDPRRRKSRARCCLKQWGSRPSPRSPRRARPFAWSRSVPGVFAVVPRGGFFGFFGFFCRSFLGRRFFVGSVLLVVAGARADLDLVIVRAVFSIRAG